MSCYSARGLERLVELAQPQPGLQLAGRAAGGGHQPGGVLGDDLLVHPRPLDQPALGVGAGGEPEQVVQALVVPRPDGLVQVGAGGGDVVLLLVRLAPQDPVGVGPGLGRDVGLDPDDRRDARVLGLPVELGGAVHVAVVGHRHVRHALALDLGEQFLEPGRAVQHRVLGVHVQVGERRTGLRHDEPPPQGTLRNARHPRERSQRASRVITNPVPTTLIEHPRSRPAGAPTGSGWSLMSISDGRARPGKLSNINSMLTRRYDNPGERYRPRRANSHRYHESHHPLFRVDPGSRVDPGDWDAPDPPRNSDSPRKCEWWDWWDWGIPQARRGGARGGRAAWRSRRSVVRPSGRGRSTFQPVRKASVAGDRDLGAWRRRRGSTGTGRRRTPDR